MGDFEVKGTCPLLQSRELEAPLNIEIQAEYQKLITLLAQVPNKLKNKKSIEWAGDKASVSGVIAYLIGWGELLITWYENGVAGKAQVLPGEGFDTWDYIGLAKHFYQKYSHKNPQEQEKHFFAVVSRITEIVDHEYTTGNLTKLEVWPWCRLSSGKQWPLEKWVRVNSVAPYKRASMQLRKLLKG